MDPKTIAMNYRTIVRWLWARTRFGKPDGPCYPLRRSSFNMLPQASRFLLEAWLGAMVGR